MKKIERLKAVFRIGVGLLICVSVETAAAYGAVFTVNTTVDGVDAYPGNGICATADNACTLRAAVMEANALAGLDTIFLWFFPSPVTLTIPPGGSPGSEETTASVGDLDIKDDLFILPTALAITATVDGGDLDRVFHIHPRVTVVIAGLTIQNGFVEHGRAGGGIRNEGVLALISCMIRNNQSMSFSGGIGNSGELTLLNSTVFGNASIFTGGGIGNGGTLTLLSSTVEGNSAQGLGFPVGGGIHNGGTAYLTASTISGNFAGLPTYSNGGIGGGINNSGTVIVTNSTVSGNYAVFTADGIDNDGTLLMTNSTIANNSGVGIRTDTTNTFLMNTIIADNHKDCFLTEAGSISQGYNLDSDGTCNLNQPTDLPGVDPMLGSLTNNGGWTETHALLFGSPAINAAAPACPPTDQRGVVRPQGARCDIGAFESEGLRRINP